MSSPYQTIQKILKNLKDSEKIKKIQKDSKRFRKMDSERQILKDSDRTIVTQLVHKKVISPPPISTTLKE